MSLPQRTVHFHGDDLVAVQQPDGTIFVVFIRLCENLGLNRLAQVRLGVLEDQLYPAAYLTDAQASP